MVEKKKLDVLDRVQLRAEDPYPKYHFTKDAGKPKPKRVLMYRAAKSAVLGFVSDIFVAIKTIIKEIM